MSTNNYKVSLYISIVTLLLIVMAAMVVLVIHSGKKGPEAFFARSINDASYDCEVKIGRHFKSELISKSFDGLSSRYDEQNRQYLIYYNVGIRERVEDGYYVYSDRMVKCIVWERFGYVSDFQVMDI